MAQQNNNLQNSSIAGVARRKILRAVDIIPPYGGPVRTTVINRRDLPQTVEISPEEKELLGRIPEDKYPAPASSEIIEDLGDNEFEVPKFHLAGQIMAQQRKAIAQRRMGPARVMTANSTPQPTADNKPAEQNPAHICVLPSSPQQKVISEIVQRDLDKLLMTGADF